MRLTSHEIASIQKTFHELFGEGKIYLFGSRADDTQKGGDIDLYLEVPDHTGLPEKKAEFLSRLTSLIGEQKIDVVFNRDDSRLIEQEAKTKGVELNIEKLKLEKYFHECDKHIQRIEEAYEDIRPFLPISTSDYIALGKEQVQAIDQYLFRFAKLQDTMGDKIFRHMIALYEDNTYALPFIDVLNKLEKLEYLFSVKEWNLLRQLRNDISHQYDDEPEEMSQAINAILNQKEIIIGIYRNLKKKYSDSFPTIA